MLQRLVPVLVAAAALVAPLRDAHASGGPDVTFATVDSVSVRGMVLSVTGIPVGGSTPTSVVSGFSDSSAAERCDRLALLAMTKPGKYQLSLVNGSSGDYTCQLTVINP